MVDIEIPLAGGNVSRSVVRIGDTVRRNLTATSTAVHKLLRHLEAKGFQASPRFLGIDDKGREMLSFIAGETGIPEFIWQTDRPLIATAQLLKAYHDATVDFDVTGETVWAYRYGDENRHEVICHNDFAPYNFVFVADTPIGVIDFDLVGPGPRLRDVAYAAFWMTPLSFHSRDQKAYAAADANAGSRRLKLFCNSYGIAANARLLEMVEEVLWHMGNEEQVAKMIGEQATAALKAGGHLAHWRSEAETFQRNRNRLERNLDLAEP